MKSCWSLNRGRWQVMVDEEKILIKFNLRWWHKFERQFCIQFDSEFNNHSSPLGPVSITDDPQWWQDNNQHIELKLESEWKLTSFLFFTISLALSAVPSNASWVSRFANSNSLKLKVNYECKTFRKKTFGFGCEFKLNYRAGAEWNEVMLNFCFNCVGHS